MVRVVVWLLVLAVLRVITVVTYSNEKQHEAMRFMVITVTAFVLGMFVVNPHIKY